MNAGFILLPGGGMSSWIWDKIVPMLSAKAVTPDYRLEHNTLAIRKTATIKDCVDYNVALIKNAQFDKVLIAAHSGAGGLAAAIAKEISNKVLHVVYISANIPKNHSTPLDSLPFILKYLNSRAIKSQVLKDSSPLLKKAKLIRKYFCNTCSEETIEYVLQHQLLSEPLCLAFEKYDWDNFPNVPQTYIMLTKDNTLSVKQQEKMMKNLNITNQYKIDSDHMVMLSYPNELSKVLNRIMYEEVGP